MIKDFYLIVSEKGRIRTTKGIPGLYNDEIAIQIKMILPNILFKRPSIHASIEIPEDMAKGPDVDAKIVNHLDEVIKRGSDLKIELQIIKPEEDNGK